MGNYWLDESDDAELMRFFDSVARCYQCRRFALNMKRDGELVGFEMRGCVASGHCWFHKASIMDGWIKPQDVARIVGNRFQQVKAGMRGL